MKTRNYPKARTANLVAQEAGDEYLVFDMDTNRAFALNRTLAAIWLNCDGKKDVDEIANLFRREFDDDVPDELIELGISQLAEANLIVPESSAIFSTLSRREAIRRIGFGAAISLPLITSIVAPSSAAAASCSVPATQVCQKTSDCCPTLNLGEKCCRDSSATPGVFRCLNTNATYPCI
ncbi:MAG: PqqD family protein [Pyrinomonadaceae bacterium]